MDQFSSHPLYRKHDLESVMSSLWSFYIKNFVVLIIASFIVNLGVQFLTSKIDISAIYSMTDPMEILEEFKKWIWPMVAAMGANLILTVILQYYIIFKPADSNLNIFSAVYKSMKYLIPYLIIMILFMFFAAAAMLAGLIVFIVGIIFSMLYVFMIGLFILPVLMAEGNNIGNAVSRTFILSHRHFWPNLGYTTILLLIIIVGSLILSSLILIPFSGSYLKILRNPDEAAGALTYLKNPWYIILSAFVGSVFTPLMQIFAAILYFNGKAREEDIESSYEAGNEPGKIRVEDLYAKPYADNHPDNPDNK